MFKPTSTIVGAHAHYFFRFDDVLTDGACFIGRKCREFFVQMNPLAIEDEMLWQERYYLDLCLLPKFIEQGIALKILTIGKAINFLRRLCGDSEWIMGPMAKVSKAMNRSSRAFVGAA